MARTSRRRDSEASAAGESRSSRGIPTATRLSRRALFRCRREARKTAFPLLLAKKVYYVLMDELVVQYIFENHPNEARTKLSVGTTPLLKRALHLAVRQAHPEAASIVERFNAQLRGMIADCTYHRLLNVSWILADVDGDGITELVPKNDLSGREPPEQAYVAVLDRRAGHETRSDGTAFLRGRQHLHGLGGRAAPATRTRPRTCRTWTAGPAPSSRSGGEGAPRPLVRRCVERYLQEA